MERTHAVYDKGLYYEFEESEKLIKLIRRIMVIAQGLQEKNLKSEEISQQIAAYFKEKDKKHKVLIKYTAPFDVKVNVGQGKLVTIFYDKASRETELSKLGLSLSTLFY